MENMNIPGNNSPQEKDLNQSSSTPKSLDDAISQTEHHDGEVSYFNNGKESYFTTYGSYYIGTPPTDGSYGGKQITQEEYEQELSNTAKKLLN